MKKSSFGEINVDVFLGMQLDFNCLNAVNSMFLQFLQHQLIVKFYNCGIYHYKILRRVLNYCDDKKSGNFQFVINYFVLVGKYVIRKQNYKINDIKNVEKQMANPQGSVRKVCHALEVEGVSDS